MSLLSKVKLKQQAYELDAYRAPAHFFFCRRIEIPADLEKGEEEGYVLLELEGMSPFPIEHLYYGYRLDENRRFAFVFAAYKRRFEGVDIGAWRKVDAAIPDFLVALKERKDETSPLVIVTERSYVAFGYDGQSSLPARFAAAKRPEREEGEEGSEDKEIEGFWKSVSEKLGGGVPRIWLANTNAKWVGQKAWFGAVAKDGSPEAQVSFERGEFWKIDLRDPDMVEQAQKEERQNAVLWKVVMGLAAAVALLLVGEVYWAGSSFYQKQRLAGVESRKAQVTSIDILQSTVHALQTFKDSNLVPFDIIESLVPYTRYPEVIFRRFETDGPDILIIDALSSTEREMSDFKKRLEGFEKIVRVELSNKVVNTNGSTFKAKIFLVPGAYSNIQEVASNE